MIKNILKFIYNIEEIGIYKRITILGIKITTKPKLLRIESKIDDLRRNLYKFYKYVENVSVSQHIHPEVFSKYRNMYLGKDIVLIATGPTLNDYIPIKNVINVGVNHAFEYDKVKLDYLFLQDGPALGNESLDNAAKYGKDYCTKFYGMISDREGELVVPQYQFDNANAIKFITNMATSPFDKFAYDIRFLPLAGRGSISFTALNFIAWTHPKRIFIVGCDCSGGGHFKKDDDTSFYGYMLNGWNDAKNFMSYHYPDIELISVNPVGLKGMFKDIYTKDGKYVDDEGNEFIF